MNHSRLRLEPLRRNRPLLCVAQLDAGIVGEILFPASHILLLPDFLVVLSLRPSFFFRAQRIRLFDDRRRLLWYSSSFVKILISIRYFQSVIVGYIYINPFT